MMRFLRIERSPKFPKCSSDMYTHRGKHTMSKVKCLPNMRINVICISNVNIFLLCIWVYCLLSVFVHLNDVFFHCFFVSLLSVLPISHLGCCCCAKSFSFRLATAVWICITASFNTLIVLTNYTKTPSKQIPPNIVALYSELHDA